ncbi:hypothetical protein R3P82_12560 [Dietzia maris]|uniref:Uncharacterized protein n=1 Tax=Dietzia maris TaxID=37915 RepID=A0AAE4QX34_9ACTN|nr:hypothetical protein [Dietzia maris]MDV6299941.1 hypothetical protein [Dietzia maris]
MRAALWAAWHLARGHLVTLGRPYDAPIGTVARCRCGALRQLI